MNLRLAKLLLCFVLSISLILPSTILVFAEGNSLQNTDIKVLTDYFKQKINERKANIDAFVKTLHNRTVTTVSITDVRFNAQKNVVSVSLTLKLNTGSISNVTYDYELRMAQGNFQFGLLCEQEDNSGKLVRQGLWFPNTTAPSFSRLVTLQDIIDILHYIKTGEIPTKPGEPGQPTVPNEPKIPLEPTVPDEPKIPLEPTVPDEPINIIEYYEIIENYIKQTLQKDSDGRFKNILFKLYGGLIIRNVKINSCSFSLPAGHSNYRVLVNVTFSRLLFRYTRTLMFDTSVSTDYSQLGLKLIFASNVKNLPNIEYWSPKTNAPTESYPLTILTIKPFIDKFFNKGNDNLNEFSYKVLHNNNSPEIVKRYIEENKYKETQGVLHTDSNTYIVLTMGSQPTSGYSIEIKNVVLQNNEITVSAKYIAPPKDRYVTQVPTCPVSVIELNRVYKETVKYDIEKFDVQSDEFSYTVIEDNFPEFIRKIFDARQHEEFQMVTNDHTNTYIVVSLGDAYPKHHIQVKDVKLQGNKILASIRYVVDPEIPPRPPFNEGPEYVSPAPTYRKVAIKLNKLYNIEVEYDIEKPIIEQPSGFSYEVLQGNFPKIVQDYIERGMYKEGQQALYDTDKTYIVLTMGTKRTGGYYISVENIALRNGKIIVFATYHNPAPNAIVTQAITHPVAVIALNKVYTEPIEYIIKGSNRIPIN